MLISTSYFRGSLHIGSVSGNANVQEDVKRFILQHEAPFLQAILGYDLWSELNTAYEASVQEVNPVALEDKWSDLVNGVVFSNLSGVKKKFVGLANGTDYLSPTANYVYWKYLEDQAIQATSIGTVKTNPENATVVGPVQKMVAAWGQMLTDVNILWEFLEANRETYTSYDTAQVDYSFVGACAPGVFNGQNIFGI